MVFITYLPQGQQKLHTQVKGEDWGRCTQAIRYLRKLKQQHGEACYGETHSGAQREEGGKAIDNDSYKELKHSIHVSRRDKKKNFTAKCFQIGTWELENENKVSMS